MRHFNLTKGPRVRTWSYPKAMNEPPMRLASWILIGLIGMSIAACQTQSASTSLPTPASREACMEKARQEVPSSSSQSSSEVQKNRYFIYVGCMHAAGLKP